MYLKLLRRTIQHHTCLQTNINHGLARNTTLLRNTTQLKSQSRNFLYKAWNYGSTLSQSSTTSGSATLLKGFKYSTGFLLFPLCKNSLFKTAQCDRMRLSHKSRVSTLQDHMTANRRDNKFNWSMLWDLMKPDFAWFLFAAACAFAVAIVNVKIPLLLGELVNSIASLLRQQSETKDVFQELYDPCRRLVTNYIIQSALTFLYITSLSCFGERMAARMRMKLFQNLLEQDVAFFDAHKTGEVVNRLTTDIQDFKSSFKQVISQGLRSITQVIGGGLTLYALSPKLTSLMILVLPGIILMGTGLGTLLRRLSKDAQEQISLAMAIADEAIGNIRTVRAFAMEPKEIGWYGKEIQESRYQYEILGAGIGAFQGLANFAINGIVLLVLYTGTVLISSKEMAAGDLMSYLVATQSIQKSLGTISVLFGQIVRGMSSGARVFEYMEHRPTMRLSGGIRIPTDDLKGRVSFNNVKFSYPTRPDQVVIHDLSLDIESGKTVALCGSSGSGKSTIAALIERFYDVQGGEVTIDGVNVRELDPAWVRGEVIGYINQEPTLFATTVMENIRYGSPNATDQEVYEAAKKANADEFIKGFPQGYHTMVGERGTTVSGGQKQRIAIARALLKDPKILILDEATSALDAESERIVQDALDKLIKGRTVIVIAHRLSTIQNADLIAAISKGRIIEIGTHAELLQKNGLYADLVRRQTQH